MGWGGVGGGGVEGGVGGNGHGAAMTEELSTKIRNA